MSIFSQLKLSGSFRSAEPDRAWPAELPLDEKPFRLAKSFSLIAIIMIFAAVLTLAAVVSRQAEVIITKRVEDDTLKLIENLTHQMYENFLKKVTDPNKENVRSRLREQSQQVLLNEVITNTIYGFDLKRVVIYERNEGRAIYDTEHSLAYSSRARGNDYIAYLEAIALYTPSEPDSLQNLPWWAGGGFKNYFSDTLIMSRWPDTSVFRPRLPLKPLENYPYYSPGSFGPADMEPPNLPDSAGGLDNGSVRQESLDNHGLTAGLTFRVPDISIIRSEENPGRGSREDTYLESIRAQTVFRYDGGGYLFLNFFPRGNFVLRSYKVMEDPNWKYSEIARRCESNLYQMSRYLPIICKKWSMTGVVELDRDLTAEYRQIARLQYFALTMAFILAVGLTIVLRWVVSRGEAIITKRNLERQALRAQLDQSERLAGLGSMVATVAHEIRNPLGIIHSTADVLNRFLSSNPDQARLARAIVEEANRLSQVVTEFLDFARPPTPRLEPLVVEEILEEILAFLEMTLSRAGIETRTDFRENPTPVPGDASMLHRAFLNILINAIQAMDDGGLIEVRTSLEPDHNNNGYRLLVTISDTGPGLTEEAVNKMFSPFYTTKAKGTGLGLVIVRNIIEGHGGEIELKNGPPPKPGEDAGPGLTVNIRLKF